MQPETLLTPEPALTIHQEGEVRTVALDLLQGLVLHELPQEVRLTRVLAGQAGLQEDILQSRPLPIDIVIMREPPVAEPIIDQVLPVALVALIKEAVAVRGAVEHIDLLVEVEAVQDHPTADPEVAAVEAVALIPEVVHHEAVDLLGEAVEVAVVAEVAVEGKSSRPLV